MCVYLNNNTYICVYSMLKERKTGQQCVKERKAPVECLQLMEAFTQCKRDISQQGKLIVKYD